MANSEKTNYKTLIAAAAIAFVVGRVSVGEKVTTPEPFAPSAQQFMEAHVAAEEPDTAPIVDRPATALDNEESLTRSDVEYTPPQRFSEPSVYYRNCSVARAVGAAPVYAGDPGYAPHLDRDGDGVGCE